MYFLCALALLRFSRSTPVRVLAAAGALFCLWTAYAAFA
jgi:hypothetical protein